MTRVENFYKTDFEHVGVKDVIKYCAAHSQSTLKCAKSKNTKDGHMFCLFGPLELKIWSCQIYRYYLKSNKQQCESELLLVVTVDGGPSPEWSANGKPMQTHQEQYRNRNLEAEI